jgi:hypothetical protein
MSSNEEEAVVKQIKIRKPVRKPRGIAARPAHTEGDAASLVIRYGPGSRTLI